MRIRHLTCTACAAELTCCREASLLISTSSLPRRSSSCLLTPPRCPWTVRHAPAPSLRRQCMQIRAAVVQVRAARRSWELSIAVSMEECCSHHVDELM